MRTADPGTLWKLNEALSRTSPSWDCMCWSSMLLCSALLCSALLCSALALLCSALADERVFKLGADGRDYGGADVASREKPGQAGAKERLRVGLVGDDVKKTSTRKGVRARYTANVSSLP